MGQDAHLGDGNYRKQCTGYEDNTHHRVEVHEHACCAGLAIVRIDLQCCIHSHCKALLCGMQGFTRAVTASVANHSQLAAIGVDSVGNEHDLQHSVAGGLGLGVLCFSWGWWPHKQTAWGEARCGVYYS